MLTAVLNLLSSGRSYFGRKTPLMLEFGTYNSKQIQVVPGKTAVLITGCDSGLGYAFARHCIESLKLVVIACCLEPHGEGALELLKDYKEGLHVLKLDLLSLESIADMKRQVSELIEARNYELHAVVNNAGVMTMGDFEWFTQEQITEMVTINLIGAMKVTKTFIPALREAKGRIVNISSHCSLEAMPGLSVYSATKAALEAWSTSLRMELQKFNVDVVTLIPGSYVTQSHILKEIKSASQKMWSSMSEADRNVHEKNFVPFYEYMNLIPVPKLVRIRDERLMNTFERALLSRAPLRRYVNAPWRYKLYFFLFAISPTLGVKEYLIKRFVSLPGY